MTSKSTDPYTRANEIMTDVLKNHLPRVKEGFEKGYPDENQVLVIYDHAVRARLLMEAAALPPEGAAPFRMPDVLDRIIYDMVDQLPTEGVKYDFIHRLAKLPDGYYSGFGTACGHRGWPGMVGITQYCCKCGRGIGQRATHMCENCEKEYLT